MMSLMERLANGEVLISDGAMGTLLQAKGLKPGECPEGWTVSHPEAVKSVAQMYIDSGSDIVGTDSFGGTYYKLREFGEFDGLDDAALSEKVYEFNKAAAQLAKDAMDGRGYVAASVGPTGQIVEDEGGSVTEQDLYRAFKAQILALVEGGADAFCFETMSSITEATQAIKAAKENTNLPIICTFTFELGVRGFRTMMGVDPERAASAAVEAGADVIGANCGNGIADMIEITRQMMAACPGTPILIHANAGLPVMENGNTVFKESPSYMASQVKELIAAGASIIGGCCGTTPDHISAMAKAAK